jgi:SAM-dependent methyltransferase
MLDGVVSIAQRCGVDITNNIVLDLGCNDGALSAGYLERGAKSVIGVDIDEKAIERAKKREPNPEISFRLSSTTSLPLEDECVDRVICFDVFEHVSQPAAIVDECYRVLKPGGKLLIGTWGWYHPFAPHLWSTMPVPWAHLFFSEKTIIKACRRVYISTWYVPNMHDLDEKGQKIEGKFLDQAISTEYLNKYLVRDFERVFKKSKFKYQIFPQHFGSKYARWTKILLKTPWLREFVTAYFWAVLTK